MSNDVNLTEYFADDEEVFKIFNEDSDILDKGIAFAKCELDTDSDSDETKSKIREILLGIEPDCNDINFMYEGKEYLILDEIELEDELDKCVRGIHLHEALNEIPKHLQCYFDEDAYCEDVIVNDGVNLLADYNGNWDERYGGHGQYYYIIRIG